MHILIEVVVENAGADRAVLLLNQDSKLKIAIEYHYGEIDTLDLELEPIDIDLNFNRSEYRIPLYLIRHVQRTQTAKIYDDINHLYLVNDPYFEKHQPQSILCIPILNQSKLIGILYLENSSISGAFTSDRLELLNIICTQAAISLENARLHHESQAYASRLEQSLRDLQTSEARLHKIADNIPGVIAQFCIYPDRDTDILRYISSGCSDLYELTAAEMIAQSYSLRCFEHPEDRPRIDLAIAQAQQYGTPLKLDYRIITTSGKVKWIHLAASSLEPQPDGSLLAECTILDISEQQAALSQRRQFELELQATNAELIRANRLKDQFMANMSHELRTPLNAILGMTEGLKEQAFGQINSAQLTALNTVECSGTHLLSLINDILDLAKIEAGQGELIRTPTAIAAICESSLIFIKQQALRKQLKIDVKIQPNLPYLNIDERRIRQALINLLSNAVKFTPTGGQISLQVAYLDNSDLEDLNLVDRRLIDSPTLGRVRITVSDTGIGISPDNLKRLFQPFIQIDGALNRKFEGTGLGLALVKRIIDLHDGYVEVNSEINLGSSFAIDLPCDKTLTPDRSISIEPSIEHNPVLNQISHQSSLILLAEDNEANINTMRSYLKAKGYRIVLAHNGLEAVLKMKNCAQELTGQDCPDLILMDIQMPEVDGISAIQQIREFSDVPIIALTALVMPGDREQCLAAGANEYLAKPVKLKQLTMTIEQLIQAKTVEPK